MGGVSATGGLPLQFGKYTVLRHIASGGMADVFLARASGIQGFEKLVVIKQIRRELTGNAEITEMFLHEARLAATLDHPNIANTYDVGKVDDGYFFTMEYVHGADLRNLLREATLKRTPVPLAEAIYVATGVCAALHCAHEKTDALGTPLGIIHRDVSPSNVLLSYDGSVKVCDFGIAKAANRRGSDTANGVMRGKASYMSPEQCRGEPLDRRSDVFSIAIVLYEITTTRKLFRGLNDFQVMQQVVERPVPSPSQVCPGYPPELARIVMKGLEKDPARRYPTAQALQIDLEAFAREHKLTLSPVGLKALMARLFAEKIEAWQAAQRGEKSLGDHLLEDNVSTTGRTPVTDFDGELAPRPAAGASRRRRLWGPIAACVVAAALLGYGQLEQRSADGLLRDEAEKLAGTVDAEARALAMRADGVAATPMLRAAISTDAATVKDMGILAPAPGQTIELFQWRGGRSVSLWRVPESEPALPPLHAREVRLARDHQDLLITTAAQVTPLYHAGDVEGSLVIARRIDLEASRARLSRRVKGASLRGLADDLPLVGAGAGENGDQLVALPIAEKNIPPLTLAVTLDRRGAWTLPAGAGCGLLAMLLFVLYLVEQRRSRSA